MMRGNRGTYRQGKAGSLPRPASLPCESLGRVKDGGPGEGRGSPFSRKGPSPLPRFTLIYIHHSDLAGFSVQHVHGTTQSRVKGADEPRHVDGIFHIGDGHADEGLLEGAAHSGIAAGRAVPEGRGDDLVIGDLAVANLGKVHE